MLRDISEPSDAAREVARAIGRVAPDIIALQDIDYDLEGRGLGALARLIMDEGGPDYPHRLALRPNAGLLTDLDMDGDGLLRGPRDAQGYGNFSGDGGMAILSVHPIDMAGTRDLTPLLWDALPGTLAPRPPFPTPEAAAVWRLSSVGHWIVPVAVNGRTVTVMTWSATPPIFDGEEDLNGRRNHDETAIWSRLLDGDLDTAPPAPPFVLLGLANIDPVRGEGRREALRALASDPRLMDLHPVAPDGTDATATFDSVGPLRLSYIYPSADIGVVATGIDPGGPEVEDGPRHRLVWADLALP